jgi:tRNA(fMet)-specific endonuclease VapC
VAYLLDTEVVSDLMKRPQGAAARRIAEVGFANVRTSKIVTAEIHFGIACVRDGRRLARTFDDLLEGLMVEPFGDKADILYGQIRARLETIGQLIGPMDLMIAAHALALGDTLVTGNERAFARVPGLRVENWLR